MGALLPSSHLLKYSIMASVLKSIIRKALRTYLTYSPITKGRYPLMMLVHKYASEPVTIEVKTKDRGKMKLDIDDMAQFPLYYNIYEWRDSPTIISLSKGARVILDIGGNVGQMALLFTQYAKKVYTFEPIQSKAERLSENIKLNHLQDKIILSQIALSNFKGKIEFGLPQIGNGGTGSIVITEQSKNNTVEVDAITLDEFIEQNNISDIDLVKMDIEGAELFALQGMTSLLSGQNKPILILEMTIIMMKQAGYGTKELLSLLDSFGYQCYEFTKNGLKGPFSEVFPQSENYCFLTSEHLLLEKVKKVLLQ
jgi:FkbM family methyltransferase